MSLQSDQQSSFQHVRCGILWVYLPHCNVMFLKSWNRLKSNWTILLDSTSYSLTPLTASKAPLNFWTAMVLYKDAAYWTPAEVSFFLASTRVSYPSPNSFPGSNLVSEYSTGWPLSELIFGVKSGFWGQLRYGKNFLASTRPSDPFRDSFLGSNQVFGVN